MIILNKNGVIRVVGDHCRYGLVSIEKGHTGPARKNTAFMTNSQCVVAD